MLKRTTSQTKLLGERAYRVRLLGNRVGTVIREQDGRWTAYSARDGQRVATLATREQAAQVLA